MKKYSCLYKRNNPLVIMYSQWEEDSSHNAHPPLVAMCSQCEEESYHEVLKTKVNC